jgi:pyruvate/2-oxoglutarate dehydrogenase complex dihydrolipoamide acyltransferase (E2) component
MPDLDLGDQPITAGCWLTPLGREVIRGDRVLEVMAAAVTVDLPSPASGRLVEQCVLEGDLLQIDQLLAVIESAEGDEY